MNVYLRDLPPDIRLHYDTAGLYIKNLVGSSSNAFAISLLTSIVELMIAKSGTMPTLAEIVEYIVWRKPCNCQRRWPGTPKCLDQMNRRECSEAMKHLLGLSVSEQWNCSHIHHVLQYKILQHRYPTLDELRTFTLNMYRFQFDHHAYCRDTRVRIGTLIERYQCDDPEESTCALCFETISRQKKYRLPCNHTFHAKPEDCIDSNIQSWFNDNIQCPMCRCDIRNLDPTLDTIIKL